MKPLGWFCLVFSANEKIDLLLVRIDFLLNPL